MEKQEIIGEAESPEEKIARLTAENAELKEKNAELEEKVKRLKELSVYDELTGIFNRRGGRDSIGLIASGIELVKDEKREGEMAIKKFSVLLADIDDFKKINDTFGHDTGDKVLRAAAEFLKDSVRASDVVARWGGEEFLVAFRGADAQDIINKFFDKEAKMGRISFTAKTDQGDINVTMSCGVTDYRGGEKIDAAVDRADQALYKSKESGKNRITKYVEPSQQGK